MKTEGTLTVHTGRRGAELSDLFGIFFEDLNHAADGGLYAELVQNRSFEFDPIDKADYHALTAWEPVIRGDGQAVITVEDKEPLNARNLHYAVIDIVSEGGGVGIMNLGFNSGIPVKEGDNYKFSMYARRDNSWDTSLTVTIEGVDGTVYGAAEITVNSSEWDRYEAVIQADSTDNSSRLVILAGGSGKVCLDMVSLFPEKTFLNRPGGLREDLSVLLADMKPKFMRFPGGCLIHDGSLNPDDRNSMYRWKNTIGDIAQRPPRRNNWSYNQTLGLGYLEYFQFSEDIGAKPIPVLPGGYDPHHKRIVPLDELQPWIDDALDLIEFANGDSSTEWGGIRAGLGHPEPFGLEYIGIGNEEVGEPFFERYPYFHEAIKAKYPEIKVINSSGPFSAGKEYERGWASARANGSDLVDEHYYAAPEWFLANHHRYDEFKAGEPKVFLGEYASWGNTYYNALVEAAFMTGLQNNAHAVGLACYAPMLCNVDYVNWKPDMIWFNNHQAYGTANYYVQKLFMNHQGDQLLEMRSCGFAPAQAQEVQPITGAITLAVDASAARFSEISLVNNLTGEVKAYADLSGEVADLPDPALNGAAKRTLELGPTHWTDYTLSLKAVRTGGTKGFVLYFGKADEQNHLFWEIGGWQNQDSIVASIAQGRNSVLTHTLFTVESDVEYNLTLEVSGRQIRTYIDGELINETEDKLLVIEPLYYTASVEHSTGDMILKTVNMQEVSIAAEIVLEGLTDKRLSIEVYEMSGHQPEDENSFKQPMLVSPKQKALQTEGSSFVYEFPKQSVTVMRLR
ncbi:MULTISPECIES: alpha-L-arabinofuranosidase C-terminal domain-containing protein [Paenibacillus]|uniref:non-reducing end alpha-L-arabinofuranosidase n=1 Tax=Paenibacillus borealis TaxID=160799 RepID=A0ABX3H527_PAEBO|nr:alpha-L-arabinofuranosidase C-terminal domain-containing protein [Paenibacillus borealis]OMD43799.1 alpha-L-arabinofuranosidase [Paenibacillus borealis]